MALRARAGKWSWRFTLDGREYSGASGLAATKRNATAARDMETEHRRAIVEGRSPSLRLRARKFSDAAQEYLTACRAEHRDRSSTARRIAVSFTSLLAAFDGLMVAQVTAREIERYKAVRITEHKVRDVTLRHDLHALSGFFRWSMRMGYAAMNPVREVRIPSDREAVRMHVLSAAEERAYFQAALADPLLHDFARLMLLQGARPDELLRLTAADVDVAAGTAKITRSKTAAGRRTLTLASEARSILARRCAGLAQGAPIFAVSPSGLAKKHARCLRASGCKFVLYDFRHTFATRMAESGCDIATLAAIMGHSSLRLLTRYIHPTAEHQAAAMLRFDAARIGAESEAVQ